MFRWTCCCFLMLAMSASARDRVAAKDSATRLAETADSTFGLQVQMGEDGLVAPPRVLPVKVGRSSFQPEDEPESPDDLYSDEVYRDDLNKGKINLTQWQNVEEIVGQDALSEEDVREWQILPQGLMYKAYLAGEKESRISSVWNSVKGRQGTIWENTLGGHVGLLRYGNRSATDPRGWQLDLEGASMVRIDMGHSDDVEAMDYRAGFLSTWRYGPNAYKFGYYHLSSHAGDEYLIRVPSYHRLNYVRDSFILGWTRFLTPDVQSYAEVAYAANHEDGAQPWEFQYGLQYSPMVFGFRGAPFAAVNGHSRQDLGWITSVTAQAGWMWRGDVTNRTFRVGVQYYSGPEIQWEFSGRRATMTGAGMWMDY